MNSLLVGLDGKPLKSEKDKPCPKCGRNPKERIPSCGFGEPYLICKCGYEFKELKCQIAIP